MTRTPIGFLILDVSRYKYPPVWVETAQLFDAMARSIDGPVSGRGFVLVRRMEKAGS